MVIGSRWTPEPLVKAAKEMGHWVLATHWVRGLEKIPTADETRPLNPNDTQGAIKLFKQYGINAVVYDADDNALLTAGVLCDKFDLPGPDRNAVLVSTNKKIFRAQHVDMLIPPFFTGHTVEDVYSGIEQVGGFPAIIKPIDNQWGRGVRLLNDSKAIQSAFLDAVAQSSLGEFIVEKFIDGNVVIVDSFALDQNHHIPMAIAKKSVWGEISVATKRVIYQTGLLDSAFSNSIMEKHIKLVKSLHYNFGFSHSEFIIDPDNKLWLLESTNRGSSFLISSVILPIITGRNLLKQVIQLATNEPLSSGGHSTRTSHNLLAFVLLQFFREGKITNIHGLEAARVLSGILCCETFFRVGDSITSETLKHGYAIISARTNEELLVKEKALQSLIRANYEHDYTRSSELR